MVTGQGEHLVAATRVDSAQLLAHRVGCALVPVGVLHGLLRREDLDEAAGEAVEAIRGGDVAIEGRRVELGEDEHLVHTRVDAVADGNVDQTILATDGYCRL